MIHRKVTIKKGDETFLFLELNDYGIKAKKKKGKGTVYAWKTTLDFIQRIIGGFEKNGDNFKGGTVDIHYAVKDDPKSDKNLEKLMKEGRFEI